MTEKITQNQFLAVKEKLDYHRLPSSFPIEATPLLAKILSKLDSRT